MYINASIHKLAEVSGTCPIRDFLLAIQVKDSAYSIFHQSFQDFNPRPMNKVIEHYWYYLKLHSAVKKGREHSVFATNQAPTTKSNFFNPTYRDNQLLIPQCICGNTHWFSDCYYLNPKKKPTGWSENSETCKKVDKALKDPAIKNKVQTSLAKRLLAEQKQAEQ